MKIKSLIAVAIIASSITAMFSFTNATKSFKYLQVTTIESVVPMGLGRSRMITMTPDGNMEEVKLENFYSAFGINFGNVRANDQMITDKIESLANEGWRLNQVTSGVESTEGKTGIFITRYLFEKEQ